MSDIPVLSPFDATSPRYEVRRDADGTSTANVDALINAAEIRRRKQADFGAIANTDAAYIKLTYVPALLAAAQRWVINRLVNGDPMPPYPPIADTTNAAYGYGPA